MTHQRFLEAIGRLGKNDKERAAKLGLTTRALTKWRHELPGPIARLMCSPELIEALADDARASCAAETADTSA
jgi:hypothetical protein